MAKKTELKNYYLRVFIGVKGVASKAEATRYIKTALKDAKRNGQIDAYMVEGRIVEAGAGVKK